MNDFKPRRRQFLKNLLLAAASTTLLQLPSFVWAALPTDKRLLVVILRGAMDGLGVIPPIGDPDYHQARGELAFIDKGFVPLNNFFALNDALSSFQGLFNAGELLILHATATPYRERSHFDGQDLLENGSIKAHDFKTGWLGRVVDNFGGKLQSLAIGPTVPLLLQGKIMAQAWSPSFMPPADHDFMSRITYMYAADPLLSKSIQPILSEVDNLANISATELARKEQFESTMAMAAKFMTKENGARLGAIDLGGWDTHAGQGLNQGRLGQALKNLSQGVAVFKQGMGNLWDQTAILVITEFGRTVMGNGSGGSDHGTGTAAFLLGGKVNGGRIMGDWPGLAQNALYEGRDLYPANDLRCLLKGALRDHLQIEEDILEQAIFPQSASAKPYDQLFKV